MIAEALVGVTEPEPAAWRSRVKDGRWIYDDRHPVFYHQNKNLHEVQRLYLHPHPLALSAPGCQTIADRCKRQKACAYPDSCVAALRAYDPELDADMDRELTIDERLMIDQAWEMHKAAAPAAIVINDNQPGKTAIIEILVDPPTLVVGTKLFREPVIVKSSSARAPKPEGGEQPVAWRDIASAPKDGSEILAFGPMPGINAQDRGWTDVRKTKWNVYPEGCPAHKAWLEGRGPRGSDWVWYESSHNWQNSWKPTHWMPLPAEPSARPSSPAVSVTGEKRDV